jgi:hypothetical protein
MENVTKALQLGFDIVEAQFHQDFEESNYLQMMPILPELEAKFKELYIEERQDRNMNALEIDCIKTAFDIYYDYLVVRFIKKVGVEELSFDVIQRATASDKIDLETSPIEALKKMINEARYSRRLLSFAMLNSSFTISEIRLLFLVFKFFDDFCQPAKEMLKYRRMGITKFSFTVNLKSCLL